MSSLFFYLFFYSFVEYVHIDTLTYLMAPGPSCGAEGRWRNVALTGSASVRRQLCCQSVPLSNNVFFSFLQRRLKIDPAGRAVPAGLHAGTTTGTATGVGFR